MLEVYASANSAEGKKYFDNRMARSDYYAEKGLGKAKWQGYLADRLGVRDKEVSRKDFHALCEGKNPWSKGSLTQRRVKNRRPYYDFTFSLPKSVSLVWMQSQDQRIIEALNASVQETMKEAQEMMRTRVRASGKMEDRKTGNMLWTGFTDYDARPVNGKIDPQLHVHAVVMNCTYDAKENKMKAGEFVEIKRAAPWLEARFHSRMADKMTQLGFGIRQTEKFWEIEGIDRGTIEKFSRRTQLIEKKAKAMGLTQKAKAKLGALTRESKKADASLEACREEWLSRLTAQERLDLAAAAFEGANHSPSVDIHQAYQYAADHLFARKSVHDLKMFEAQALKRGFGAFTPKALNGTKPDWLLTAEMDGRMQCTTRQVHGEEQMMMALARHMRGNKTPLSTKEYQSNFLNEQQQFVVKGVLKSYCQLNVIAGRAGVGKTTVLKEIKREVEKQGKKMYGFAPGTEASRGVLRSEGFKQAETVAHLLKSEKTQSVLKDQVMVIDEAGMLSVPEMAGILKIAKKQDCRVLLTGDTKQHGPVNRGDALHILQSQGFVAPFRLDKILRQKPHAYRQAIRSLSRGYVEMGFDDLEAMQAIKEGKPEKLIRQMANEMAEALKRGQKALAIVPTHAEGESVTAAIRKRLKKKRLLDKQDHTLITLKNTHWTEAQKSHAVHYSKGMIIQFEQNLKGITKGQRFEVIKANDREVWMKGKNSQESLSLPLHQPERFSVFQPERNSFSIGEHIRLTKNGTAKHGERLNNGAQYRIKDIQGGEIMLDNGYVLPKGFGHLSSAYVMTSYAAQGSTADHVFLLATEASQPAISMEQFYVSLSRGRYAATVFTDNKQGLKSWVKRSGLRPSAHDLALRAKQNNMALNHARLAATQAKNAILSQPQRLRQFERERD